MIRFQTTRWSLVLAARGADARSQRALERLCRTYRAPVLGYIRGRGCTADEAEDLTQSFFTHFLERSVHAQADPQRGRFRSYLLVCLRHFLNDAHHRVAALKRGGEAQRQPIDDLNEHGGDHEALRSPDDPERAFDRAWAQSVLKSALRKLRREAAHAGKDALFGKLWQFVIERPDAADYERVGRELNLRRNTLAVAVHRLRNRLRELVCAELAETAADETLLDQEIAELRQCFGDVL